MVMEFVLGVKDEDVQKILHVTIIQMLLMMMSHVGMCLTVLVNVAVVW